MSPAAKHISFLTGITLLCTSCNGIFGGVYDEPQSGPVVTAAGQLYIDASDWTLWHYIDLKAVAAASEADKDYNPSSAWVAERIPTQQLDGGDQEVCGIYTYWYDVFGEGISKREFRSKYATEPQPAPESWTFAVHRNNVRTNGATVAATEYKNLDEVPENIDFIRTLDFHADQWSESDVWVVQDRMLLGIIGSQGIEVNPVLSQWLGVEIPPVPPVFSINDGVFVIRCADGSYGAVRLVNHQSQTGTNCCLTIDFKYPLNI